MKNPRDLLKLGPEWTEEHEPVTAKAVETAASLRYVPTHSGGVNIELHAGGMDIEIEVGSNGKIENIYAAPSP